jgi:hypothetical protein
MRGYGGACGYNPFKVTEIIPSPHSITELQTTNLAALLKMLEMHEKHKHSLGSPLNCKLSFEVQERRELLELT